MTESEFLSYFCISAGIVCVSVRGLCGVFGGGGCGHRSIRPQTGQPPQKPGAVGPRRDSSQDQIPQREVNISQTHIEIHPKATGTVHTLIGPVIRVQ